MERKNNFLPILIAILAITGLGLTMIPNTVEAEPEMLSDTGAEAVEEVKAIYPYYPQDYPDVLALKGVAAKDGEIYSSFFVAIDYEDEYEFANNFLIIDGNIYELEFEDAEIFEDKQSALITFTSEAGNVEFLAKQFRINWQETVTVTANFNDYLLSMRMLGNEEPMYRIMYGYAESQDADTEQSIPKGEGLIEELVKRISE